MSKQYGSKYEYLKFLFLAHLLNPIWHKRLKRRTRRNYYNYRRVAAYLKKYIPFIKNLKIDSNTSKIEGDKEMIFSIWWQGEDNAPELVKVCIERLRNTYKDRFILLDKSSISDWVILPNSIWQKWEEGKIPYANFADICRIALLYQHGGMWFDATDFLTSKVPDWIEQQDVFIFRDGPRFTPEKFVQICFLKAKKGNPLIKAWLDFIYEYWEKEDKIIDYFLHQFMMRFLVENNTEVNKLFYDMPQIVQTPTHLLWHIHCNEPFSDKLYTECTKDTFFQKTTYKSSSAKEPIKGSISDYIINRKIPHIN